MAYGDQRISLVLIETRLDDIIRYINHMDLLTLSYRTMHSCHLDLQVLALVHMEGGELAFGDKKGGFWLPGTSEPKGKGKGTQQIMTSYWSQI